MPADKRALRLHFREILASQPGAQFRVWNEALGLHLAALGLPKGSLIAAYRARLAEANPEGLFRGPFRFCFPRVVDPLLEWCLVEKPLDPRSFTPGFKGIEEPKKTAPLVEPGKIEVCLVPLLAFDDVGGRLGHGKGFYDRFLAGFRGRKIGVAFACQRSREPLPMESHDQRLDLVVTEAGVRRFT